MQYRLAAGAAFTAIMGAFVALPAQSAGMMPSQVGAGAHGYDFLVGTWTCKNSMPSAMGGPATETATISRTTDGSLTFHASGTGFDGMGYIVYAAKTKTWWNPSVTSNGAYGTESTKQTGKKTVWSGPFMDPSSGKTVQVRDTYTFTSATSYTDLYQVNMGGGWKTQGNSTCTKS